MLGLRFCARAFSSCGKWGPLFIAVHGPLTIVASLVGSTGSRRAGSVVVAHGPSCSAACGILPDQGSNPCPLHSQADSQPLCHQGSPEKLFLKVSFICISIVKPLGPHLLQKMENEDWNYPTLKPGISTWTIMLYQKLQCVQHVSLPVF